MAGETAITLVGRLVADPELRYTNKGDAVAQFRVATNPRRYNNQTNQWEDGDASFYTCNIWRQKAEAVANQLTKGQLVILQGSIAQRSWENKEGEKRSTFEVRVDNIGPAILPPRNDQGGGYNQQPNTGGNFAARQDSDPWNAAPQSGHRPGFDDEPPY